MHDRRSPTTLTATPIPRRRALLVLGCAGLAACSSVAGLDDTDAAHAGDASGSDARRADAPPDRALADRRDEGARDDVSASDDAGSSDDVRASDAALATADDVPAATDTAAAPDVAPVCAGVAVGALDAFEPGSRTLVSAQALLVGRDARGVFAYSSICTHAGCQVSAPARGDTSGVTACPCHGSLFDGDGRVLAGPASRPLANYAVQVCAGRVFVDASREVPAGTRTPA